MAGFFKRGSWKQCVRWTHQQYFPEWQKDKTWRGVERCLGPLSPPAEWISVGRVPVVQYLDGVLRAYYAAAVLDQLFAGTNAVNIQSLLSDRRKRIGCVVLDVAMLGVMAATCLLLCWTFAEFEPLRREVRSNMDLSHGIVLPMLETLGVGLGYIAFRGSSLLLAVCSIFGRSLRSIIGWFCVATLLFDVRCSMFRCSDVPMFLFAQGGFFGLCIWATRECNTAVR